MSLGQDIAVVRHLRSPVDQPITQRLINRDRAFSSIQAYGPRGRELGLRRKIQAQRNAELALLPVNVLLQVGAAQIRCEINIRRLDCFADDGTHSIRNLVMEKARDTFIVSRVSSRALHVAERHGSAAGSHAGSNGAARQD